MGFEIDHIARQVFRRIAPKAPCAGDLMEFWPDDVRLRTTQGFATFDEMRNFLEGNASRMASTARCPDSGATFAINLGDAHCGGNPCKDWSLLGKRRGLNGPTAPILITWAILIKRHKPTLVIQENVLAFPVELLQDLLGPAYRLQSLALDPRRLGWPVARQRRYALFSLVRNCTPPSLAVLEPLLAATAHFGDATAFGVTHASSSFLSQRECDNLDVYRQSALPVVPSLVDLSQNALVRPRGATKDGALCTLTCSPSRLYMVKKGQCLTGPELLLAQAIPSTEWAAQVLGFGSVRLLPEQLSNHAAVKLAGNAMHSNCMGLILGWSVLHHLCRSVTANTPHLDGRCKGLPTFKAGHEEQAQPRAEALPVGYCTELVSFVNHSDTPVARSFRTPAVPPAAARHRDLFPMPELPGKLDGDPPEIVKIQARLVLCGLNVLWNGGTLCPLVCISPSASQRQVHFLALRRAVDWLNRMLGHTGGLSPPLWPGSHSKPLCQALA